MAADVNSSRRISVDDALGQTVGDVMIARPKTLSGDALIADVRSAFDRATVRTVLLTLRGLLCANGGTTGFCVRWKM